MINGGWGQSSVASGHHDHDVSLVGGAAQVPDDVVVLVAKLRQTSCGLGHWPLRITFHHSRVFFVYFVTHIFIICVTIFLGFIYFL